MSDDMKKQATMRGIAVMAACFDDPDEPSDLIVPTILAPEDDGADPEVVTTMGLVNLCTILLVKREKETGTPAREQLQQIALQYQ